MTAAMLLTAGAPIAPSSDHGPVKVRASETSHAVDRTHDFAISAGATHIAIHWAGEPAARLTVTFSGDGKTFSEPTEVEAGDANEAPDPGPQASDDETYGPLMGVDAVSVVRVHADRPLARVTVLALDAAGPATQPLGLGAEALGTTAILGVISRGAWGADESLRFDGAGDERWPREYFPLQKLVVHHTAGRNQDPNPAATVRAIYYFHAVTRRWGDIGYAYLIDEAGRVYEGRHSRDYWNGTIPTSDSLAGLAVAGGHAKYHNAASMGIALLGTFSTQAPTAAARASLVRMLAWASAKYHLDPRASSTYTNPLTGLKRYVPNIAGHRDYQATDCPGGVLYGLLPTIRNEVAAAMNPWPGQVFNPPRRLAFVAGTYIGYRFKCRRRCHRLQVVHPQAGVGGTDEPVEHCARSQRRLLLRDRRRVGRILGPGLVADHGQPSPADASGRGLRHRPSHHGARGDQDRTQVRRRRAFHGVKAAHPDRSDHRLVNPAQHHPRPAQPLVLHHRWCVGGLLDPGDPRGDAGGSAPAAPRTDCHL
jgi:hypothetical protein